MHPDKLIKEGTTDEEKADINEKAARVGQAADILGDNAQVRVVVDMDVLNLLYRSTEVFFL